MGRSLVSDHDRVSRPARMPLASTFGSEMATTASWTSTKSEAMGMAMSGNPMPVTALTTDPTTTATTTTTSSVPLTVAV